jgi:hypothetical protein
VSELSKEAWGLAEDLWDQRDVVAIATALQQLMDERDDARKELLERLLSVTEGGALPVTYTQLIRIAKEYGL